MNLKKCKYEDFTIENAEFLIKTNYITEIVCDGDNKTIGILEEEYQEAEKQFAKIYDDKIKPLIDSLAAAFKTICEAVQPVINAVWNLSQQIANKKISKKRFIKLLQSQGIQRNEIYQIVKNNKEPYTYFRYYNIVDNLSEDKQ